MRNLHVKFVFFIVVLCCCGHSNAQTVVYTNDFTGAGTTVPGGTPAVTFTNVLGNATRSGVQIGGTDPAGTGFTTNQLAEWVDGPAAVFLGTGTINSYSQTTAPLSGYSAPFNATLSSNTNLVTWTFNMETMVAASGFANTQDNAVVVLAGTSATVRTAGNGYAVAFNPASPSNIELVRYTGGLQGTVTTIISSSAALASATNYASVKVTYDPGTNTWSLYVRDDGAAAFANPAAGVLAPGVSAVDGTYTGTAMSVFGFFSNHEATSVGFFFITVVGDNFSYFDNFTVSLACSLPAITGTSTVCVNATTTLSNTTAGGVWSSGSSGIASVVSWTGVVTGVMAGTAIITYNSGGCTATDVVTVNPLPAVISGTASICQGSSQPLSDATTGGTWSSSTGGAVVSGTGLVTGVSAGTAAISYILPLTGCGVADVVTINPLPTAITGTYTVCAGSTTTLGAAPAGGTWSSNNGNATVAVPSSGVITGSVAGTSTIAYTLGTGCSVSAPVTVDVTPGAITGGTSICAGLTGTLSATPAGGTWSSSNSNVSVGASSGIATGVTAGTAVITYTLATGCYNTVVVTVNPAPGPVTGIPVVCEGLTTALGNIVAGGVWASTSANANVGSASGIVTGVAAGTAVISYTTATCNAVTIIATINPSPSAIGGSAAVCTGATTTLSNMVGGGTWISSNGNAAISYTTGSLEGVFAGTANITYTLPAGCFSTVVATVNSSPVAIGGSLSVCPGLTTPLADGTGIGTWASSNSVVGTIDATTGIVTGITGGTTTITYTLPVSGCTATTTLTVNPQPSPVTGAAQVCQGFTISLSDATAGGSWSSISPAVAPVAAGGVLTGLAAGTSTISYTLTATGCASTTVVTVNPNPNTVTGSDVVCIGLLTTLSDASPGGTWSSNLPGVASVGSGSGIVGGLSSGSAIISYTLPTGCYTLFLMNVSTPPAAITGTDSVCAGSTVALADAVTGGVWSSTALSGSASVGTSSGIVTGSSAGVVTISYTTTACTPVTYQLTVNGLPAPITGLGSVCAGSAISLNDVTPGGSWSSSTPAVSVSSTGLVAGLTAGMNATITYALPTGCYQTAPVLVDSLPARIQGIDSVCEGSSRMLADATPNGVWSSSNGAIATAIALTGEVIGVLSGTVHITYTLVSGCYVDTVFKVIAPLPASLTITDDQPAVLCSNTLVTFTAHPVNGGPSASFRWKVFVPGGVADTGLVFAYTPSHWDYVECTMFTGGICAAPDSVSAAMTMDVYPDGVIPVASIFTYSPDTIAYLGAEYTFHTNVTNGGPDPTYQWYEHLHPVPGATSSTFTTNIYRTDTVYCVVSGNAPCESSSATGTSNWIIVNGGEYLNVKSVSVAESHVSLFPNPNTGSFTLHGNAVPGKEINIEITDMTGRNVYNSKLIPDNGDVLLNINLDPDIVSGTYLLRVSSDEINELFHFVTTK